MVIEAVYNSPSKSQRGQAMRQTRGIYLISMVAETLDMHPQTLRKYERAGFVAPLRMGTLRTYTDEDVARLRLIKHFVDDLGLNLAGVEMALGIYERPAEDEDSPDQHVRVFRGNRGFDKSD